MTIYVYSRSDEATETTAKSFVRGIHMYLGTSYARKAAPCLQFSCSQDSNKVFKLATLVMQREEFGCGGEVIVIDVGLRQYERVDGECMACISNLSQPGSNAGDMHDDEWQYRDY